MLLISAEGQIEFGKLSKPYLNTSWFDKGNWQDHCLTNDGLKEITKAIILIEMLLCAMGLGGEA